MLTAILAIVACVVWAVIYGVIENRRADRIAHRYRR